MVYFEDDQFVSKPPVSFLFGKTVKVRYEDIERIEFVDGGALLTDGGEWVYRLVVQQLSLSVETHHLAAGAEARVDGQRAFLS